VLKVVGRREEILAAVDRNQVVLVAGETGCGKTTQVPQFLLEQAWGARAGACTPTRWRPSALRRAWQSGPPCPPLLARPAAAPLDSKACSGPCRCRCVRARHACAMPLWQPPWQASLALSILPGAPPSLLSAWRLNSSTLTAHMPLLSVGLY